MAPRPKVICRRLWPGILLLLLAAGISAGNDLAPLVPADHIGCAARTTSFKAVGRVEASGLTGEGISYFKAPDRIRTEIDLGVFTMMEGFDGETAWMIDQNGQLLVLDGAERRRMINNVYFTGQSYLLDDRMPGSVTFLKDTAAAGNRYKIFTAVPENGDTFWLFLNEATGRVEISQIRVDELILTDYLSDYRSFDGCPVSFRNRTEGPISQLDARVEMDSVEFNIALDDTLFAPPAIASDDFEFPAGADSVVVPFVYKNGHIYLKASLNGRDEVFFVLDSGAGTNIIDRAYADRIGLNISGDFPAKGIAGYESAAVAGLDSICLGGIIWHHSTVAVVDLPSLRPRTPEKPLGGILGYHLLSRLPIRVSYGDSQLVVYNPAAYVPPPDEFAAGLGFFIKIPTVEATVNGCPGRFLLDLGNSLGVVLHSGFVERCRLDETLTDVREIESGIGGIGGSSETSAAMVGRLRLGPVRLESVPVLLPRGGEGVLGSIEIDGNLGNLFLQEFDIVLDYGHKKVFILPPDN